MKITDLHIHPSAKPYNNIGYRDDEDLDIWRSTPAVEEYYLALPRGIRKVINETARDSQANLNRCVEGNIDPLFLVLHPAERGWFVRNNRKEKWLRKKLLQLILKDKHIPFLGASLTGFAFGKVSKIIKRVKEGEGIDYFEKETWEEYKFIVEQSLNTTGHSGKKLEIASTYEELLKIRQKEDSIAGILTIEGGHALTNVPKSQDFSIPWEKQDINFQKDFKFSLKRNIQRIKGSLPEDDKNFSHTPFIITLAHMYNNFLCGHAKTYRSGKSIFPGMDDLLDQETYMDAAISEVGEIAIQELLSRRNGQRILIDIKHMSMRARIRYYEIVKAKRRAGDFVPLIFTHGAVNGFEKNDYWRKDLNKLDNRSYFSRWSINLSNQDIRKIHEYEGLIGLAYHEGRMPGELAKKEFKYWKKKIRNSQNPLVYQEELKKAYVRLIAANIFQIMDALHDDPKGWDRISLGSDYDGIMDPFNCYTTVADFKTSIQELISFFQKPENYLSKGIFIYRNDKKVLLKAQDVKEKIKNFDPEELGRKIAFDNVENFLKKYFTEKYLQAKVVHHT